MSSSHETGRGVLFVFGAFLIWGLFPLYWKPLHEVPALQILCHRIAWSALFVAALLLVRRQWGWLAEFAREPKKLGVFALSSALLSTNWLIYIWAVNADRVLDASLGYFINPLVNVLLGRLFLGERLAPPQKAAVGLAALGVLWLTILAGTPPWVALSLGLSFGCYGLLRKKAPLASLPGLALETFLMLPLALGALLWFESQGHGAFGHGGGLRDALLAGAGVVTAIPLLLFAAGARRLKLATVGVIQYTSPIMQLLLGAWLFNEPFGVGRLVGFGFIWAGLALYSGAGLLDYLRERSVKPA
ncbi:EamA family transporter RarD [Pseudogulbenkiania sp. MAI-1]|uniref:EamA family transporter RarD n=1 Tax=Pseudogulbenkiania sp. MAI-1 TaxID=990370 RepID=UPI00045E7EA5|nr:EamA family transporter RarD [Pseudogulbenkiania sp. MAI-1]